jgi:hypothetical protein
MEFKSRINMASWGIHTSEGFEGTPSFHKGLAGQSGISP